MGQTKFAMSPASAGPRASRACRAPRARRGWRGRPQRRRAAAVAAPAEVEQVEGQRRARHAADAEHAVQVAHDRAAAQAFELRAFGVDGDVEETHRGAEHEHRREQRGKARILEREGERRSHRRAEQRDGIARADARDDAARNEERDDRAEGDGEQHDRQRRFTEPVARSDGRDVRSPRPDHGAEHEELEARGAARAGQASRCNESGAARSSGPRRLCALRFRVLDRRIPAGRFGRTRRRAPRRASCRRRSCCRRRASP